jgi:DNA-binding transcriptional LysR family regulator
MLFQGRRWHPVEFRRSDFADLSYFLEIARHRNFRRAGLVLGISASALSHALRGLEERVGVRLLNRTSRSVTLTAAGEELRAAILEPFETIGRAVDDLHRFRDAPRGRIRLSVPTEAADFIVAPVLPAFLERYPDVEIEISVSNRMIDVTESGFDGGIRYGGTVPEDMIAQRLAPDFRWVVVATPAYLERFGTPSHPSELQKHRGVKIRIGDDRVYRWEFERGDEQVAVDVPGALLVDQGHVALPAVKGSAALMYAPYFFVAQSIKDGVLTTVLDDWAAAGAGFHIYYSSRRQVPAGLRLFVELVREMRPLG